MPHEPVPVTEAEVTSMLVLRIAALRKLDPASVDPSSSFNSLGIDSLDAVTLLGEVEDSFGIQVDLPEIFDHPTPSDLSRMIVERHANRLGNSSPADMAPPRP